MKIFVNKCPDTGRLIEDDVEYKNHRRKVTRLKLEKKRVEDVKNNFWSWLTEEKSKITAIEQITPWFLANQRKLMDAHNAGIRGKGYTWFDNNKKFYEDDIFTKLVLDPCKLSRSISNTHSCPENGVTNFMCTPDKPIAYIGWKTDIKGALIRSKERDFQYPYASLLNLVGLKTGSGGGGNKSFGYGVSIFLDDWPGLQAGADAEFADRVRIKYEEEQNRIVSRLKNAGRWSTR